MAESGNVTIKFSLLHPLLPFLASFSRVYDCTCVLWNCVDSSLQACSLKVAHALLLNSDQFGTGQLPRNCGLNAHCTPPLHTIQLTRLCRFLKVVDKFNEWYLSAYVTASGVRLMLLHDSNADGLKAFFSEAHELYIKVSFQFNACSL